MDLKQTAKNVQLGLWDFTNRITGQDKLIEEHRKTVLKLCKIANHEKDPAKKKELNKAIQSITGKDWKKIDNGKNGFNSFKPSGFDEARPFQKKKLSTKIAFGQKTMDDFGIQR